MHKRICWTATLGGTALILATAAYHTGTIGIVRPAPAGRDTVWSTTILGESRSVLMRPHLTALAFRRNGEGFAATGWNLYRSADAGQTWQQLGDTLAGATAIAVGVDGHALVIGSSGSVRMTSDNGRTWVVSNVRAPGRIDKLTLLHGRAFGVGPGTVLRSPDSAQTWQRIKAPSASYHDVAFAGAFGIIVGSAGRILRSTDSGQTWTEHVIDQHTTLYGVAFADESIAIVVGSRGTLFRTLDAGQTWRRLSSPTTAHLHDVAFADSSSGVAVGLYGTILRTDDGGMSWTVQESGTRMHLLTVEALPSKRFIAAGWFGTLIRAQ